MPRWPDQREIRNKNKIPSTRLSPAKPLAPEFVPKKKGGAFKLLRTKRDRRKLNISEDSPFFENVGRAMQEFFVELEEAQADLFPQLKNEFLFVKETIEARVKLTKVR